MPTIATVSSIVVICYLLGYICKQITVIKDGLIPAIVGVVGGILGVLAMNVVPDFPANNIFDAIAVGIASGLASTGANQIYKQFKELIQK